VSHGHPVYIVADSFHSGAANTDAFMRIAPADGLSGVERDANGRPTGSFLTDDGHFFAARKAYASLGEAAMKDMFSDVATSAARRGVTTLHCLDGQFVEDDMDVTVLLRLQDELDVHTVVMYQTMDVERVLQLGLPRIGGCLTVDGAGFERTALFYEPYEGTSDVYGDLYIPEDKLNAFVLEAHAAGLQIGMHAIGDRAVDLLVAAYKRAQEAVPRGDCRHRVEHFYVPTEWAIGQAHALGLALPMQPAFSWSCDIPGHSEYEHYLGKERADRAEPFSRLCRLGVVVSGGSDSPITSIDPLLGIHSAVNNPNPIRRVSIEDALRMFTVNGAWVGREEQEKGTIEPGKLADLVVLGGDPHAEPSSIKDLPVEMTVCAGRVTWSAL
jgi:predicted amidohydrolase YtcJ